MENKSIIIIDYGSQYTQLIARRIRENKTYCEIFPYDVSLEKIKNHNPIGVILSGGPNSVTKSFDNTLLKYFIMSDIPILGICFGMQAICKEFGGTVVESQKREYGSAIFKINEMDPLFHGSKNSFEVWMSHGDSVTIVPNEFKLIGSTGENNISAIKHKSKLIYGLQFHPEVTHTEDKGKIIENYVNNICNSKNEWSIKNIVSSSIQSIQDEVKNESVILGLSGGVDSSVAAAIINKAIGSQLTCIFVNNGLLRLNEEEQVKNAFRSFKGIKIKFVNAEKIFLDNLKGVVDPEQKRKIIGNTFIDVFQNEAEKIKDARWLGQGTIYPDVIESAAESSSAHLIKSHHNVGGLPENMKLKLIEPLRKLFKDEVRLLGKEIGLSEEIINRHPFPGPGLGVRILGEVKSEFADILREADNIYISMIREAKLYDKISQAFSVFIPSKTVGVTGDGRVYSYIIALRAVGTEDFMTAKPFRFPNGFIEDVATRIINEVPNISRVCYDISSKPPATIEWE
ncbi:MAG: glutamine-hydrolyzing GMP synthase [Pseudomonadota bacterium]|nr:glutamine-hydrolyzing GMP synthase [Pseudomonadota bacterium]